LRKIDDPPGGLIAGLPAPRLGILFGLDPTGLTPPLTRLSESAILKFK
jgi:hypothetical protein